MKFDSFDVKDEMHLLTSDRPQKIHTIFQKPSTVFMLSSSSNDKKQLNIKEGNTVFARLRKVFKPKKLKQKIRSATISIAETTRSEQEEINVGAPPPIDESFFFENLESLRGVEIDGINILEEVWNTVSIAEMKVLTEMENGNVPERDGILFPDSDDRFRSIAFTWACIRGISHILAGLEASGADINNVLFQSASAGMCAAFAKESSCLEFLVEKGANLNYVSPLYGHCALHLATVGHRLENAKILLDFGGDLNNVSNNPHMIPLLHYAIKMKSEEVSELFIRRGANPIYKNLRGETPLHVACGVQSLKCCELLLQKPEVNVNALDEINRAPLHYATMATDLNIKLIELLLKHGALVNQIDGKGFSPLHLAALGEQAECVEMLIIHGADLTATTSKGVSALNIIVRKIPESLEAFKKKMDSSILMKRPGCQNREFEIRLDFTSLLPSDGRHETIFINSFVNENLTDLLPHPLVKAFIYLKWERIKKFYLLNIFFYALMLIFMSTYVLTALTYECYNFHQENNTSINYDNIICYYFDKRLVQLDWYIWLAFVCLMIPRKILSFMTCENYKEYLWNIDNILDTIVIMSVFATSFIYTGKTYHWQKHTGAFSVLFAWTNLMFMIGQLPGFGTYVAMFTHIQFEFAKLLFAYSGLLIGFALSFCVIFDGEPSFANLLTGLIKILTMMTGELDFEALTRHLEWSESGYMLVNRQLSICSQILFILFVIFIVFILMNLLVGIAVHDIKGLRDQAGLTKLIRTTKLIVSTEMAERKIRLSSFLKRLMSNKTDSQIRKHILLVKPLNPLEKRLPKEILKEAYEIAQKNSPILDDEYPDCNDPVSYIPKKKEEDIDATLETAVEKLSSQLKIKIDELFDLKHQLYEIKSALEQILLKVS
ncbi:transient receptor potential channel pyrexia-like [Belonocnema kinseyi]|uniref:transient receptor potential channel pyrexia-like n=1 Tax=Belonocnema kinseyi TaxID=2817044 RepID=UPI00143CF31A|nr:transient receptor potential channel pyrexia-like [Belonocnema kinseyi]